MLTKNQQMLQVEEKVIFFGCLIISRYFSIVKCLQISQKCVLKCF
eukprot:UN08271